MRISVTKNDIKQGVEGSPYSCPIARALKRNGFEHVFVDGARNPIGRKHGKRYRVSRPFERTVNKFIDLFDVNEVVKPFSFIIKMEE